MGYATLGNTGNSSSLQLFAKLSMLQLFSPSLFSSMLVSSTLFSLSLLSLALSSLSIMVDIYRSLVSITFWGIFTNSFTRGLSGYVVLNLFLLAFYFRNTRLLSKTCNEHSSVEQLLSSISAMLSKVIPAS